MRDTSGPVGSGSSREDLSQVYKLALFSCRGTMLLSCILQWCMLEVSCFFVSSEFAIVDFIKRILDTEQVLQVSLASFFITVIS